MGFLNKFLGYYNKQAEFNPKKVNLILITSIPFIIFYLAIDSIYVAENYFDARDITNILVIAYFFFMLSAGDTTFRKLLIIMAPLSYFGEYLYCNIFDMYDYRGDEIPIYIPFTHSLIFGFGYLMHLTDFAKKYYHQMKIIFPIFFVTIFLIATFVYGDMLTAIFGVLFFLVIRRKRWEHVYYYVAAFSLVLEFAGTSFGNWAWEPYSFIIIPTVNPPVGITFLYIGGDVMLYLTKKYIGKKLDKLQSK